jgi:regulatory protein
MSFTKSGVARQKSAPPPLDGATLDALALSYVARFATSSGKLRDYLARKLRERGWAGDTPPDLPALVAAMAARGYLDDAAYAAAKGEGLRRRGYGARRIESALDHAGIAAPLRAAARGSETERRHAVLAFARRKRFWPYSAGPCLDPAMRAKHLAAYLRAGHGLDHARRVMDAQGLRELEEWADEHAEDALD